MYLFFDKNGTLLEIVNDSALRQYNQDANKMYVYIQDEDGSISGKIAPSIVGLTHRYKKSNGEIVNGAQILRPSDGTKHKDGVFEYKEIPFNRKRDLKHFSYGRRYEFFVVDVPSGTITPVDYEGDGTKTVEYVTEGTVFDVAGTVLATLTTICDEQTSLVLERFAFAVEESVPAADGALSGSQFAWLIGEIIRMGNRIDGYYDYDKQNNRPIVNVDMNSSDFVAKASNYYRHVGENSAEHRNGLIYYCPEDGTLVEIDGGTSLNLNGQYTEEATVYAPTNGGDNTGVKVLVPHGDGEEPTWERLSVSSSGSVTSAGVTYSIELGGNSAGTITLPKETYIEDITFNGSTKIVTFKYNGESGRGEKTVDLSKLVDVYTAGNGLQKSGNEFSIKTNSSYLSTSSQGLSVNASSIAGLAQIYLNGSRKAANSNQFYAPTKYHTSNSNSSCWVLVPNGINTAPIWERIYVEKSGLTYTLKLGNYMIGKIELTQEIYLDDVKYNSDTNKLVFTYNTASGQSAIEVDLTDLVDMYDAGLGLEKVGNKFNVKIAPDSEKYLKATAEGLAFDESALPIGGGGGTATGNGGTLIAKTEDEMDTLLIPENVGKLVSYIGEGGGTAVGTPFTLHEIIDRVYFNTSVEPDLTKITTNEGFATLLGVNHGIRLALYDWAVLTEGAVNALAIMEENEETVFYTSADIDFSGLKATKGWNADLIANGGLVQWTNEEGSGKYGDDEVVLPYGAVGTLNQQDLWGSYISKEPFAGGGKYKKNTLYMVVEEEKETPEIAVGDTIDTLYFNTSVEPDLTALTFDGDGLAYLLVVGEVEYNVYNLATATGGAINAVALMTNEGVPFYSTEAFDFNGVSVAQGWQNLTDGALSLGESQTVTEVNQQDLWSNYISKEPFGGGAAAGTPLAVGDTISSLYFDISKELDPTIFTYDEDSGNNVRIGFDGGSYYCLDIAKVSASNSPTGQDEYQMYLGEGEVIVWVSFDFAEYGIHKGWQQPIIDAGGKVEFAEAGVISNIPQQSAWDTFVSKEPFGASAGGGGIIAKPACPAPEPELPVVTASDSGKFLRVDASGKWVAQSIPYAEEASF